MLLSNKVYDILKRVVQVILPALGTLYFALASIWDLPYPEKVVGTLAALAAFLGVILGISTRSYEKVKYDGVMKLEIDDSNEKVKKTFFLDLSYDPELLVEKKEVVFRVDNNI